MNLIDELDLLSPQDKGQNILLAARPGIGKLSLALTLVRKTVFDCEEPVALFSLEMNKELLTQRLVPGESEIPFENIQNNNLSETEYQPLSEAMTRLNQAPIYIEATPSMNTSEIREVVGNIENDEDFPLVVIDYFQLIESSDDSVSREEELRQIGNNLGQLAKDLGVTVLSLGQLNQTEDERDENRPKIGDIREFSEENVEIFDQIWFLYLNNDYSGDESKLKESNLEVITFPERRSENYQLKFEEDYLRFKDEI